MKKYKIHFSIFNLVRETQAEVVKLQTIVKSFTVALASTTFAMSGADDAVYTGIGGLIIDTALACLYFEELPE